MSTITTNPAKVRAAKSAAYAAAKVRGLTIDYRAEARTWTADVVAPPGKMFEGGSRTFVTHYYTPPDVEFWQLVRSDVNTIEEVIDIDYDQYPEYDDREH